jgi:hypothetical protein
VERSARMVRVAPWSAAVYVRDFEDTGFSDGYAGSYA